MRNISNIFQDFVRAQPILEGQGVEYMINPKVYVVGAVSVREV